MQDTEFTRRDVLAGGAAMAVTLAGPLTLSATAATAATISGTVFEDRGGTGRRGPGDPGVPGVLVSNGRDVARTDADGRYTLPVPGDCVLFVVKPTGYSVPLDAHNLPRFSYVHQPEGTPAALALRYRGVAPSGPLPTTLDFALRKADEPTSFDVVVFTDPQPESQIELDFVRDAVIAGVVGVKAAFGMTTGDIMFDDLSLYERYNRMIGQIGVPWYHIGGNHDLNIEATDRRYARETFKRVYGANYYAFEYGNVLFLMLDNVDYLGTDPSRRGFGKYEGRLGEAQRAFVENVLAQTPPERLVVLAMHIPLRNYLDAKDPSVNTADRADLLKLLGTRKAVSFSGHTHTTEHHYFGATDGVAGDRPHHHHVLTAVSGSWWSGPLDKRGIAVADSRDGTPNGYHILSIAGDTYTTRYVPASEPNGKQMRISLESQIHAAEAELRRDYPMARLLGSPIPVESAGATDVVVNVFDGGPNTAVRYRLGDRAPLPMKRVVRPDPFVRELFERNRAATKPWVKAEPSSHVWVSRLPNDVEPGTYRLEVSVEDEYGRPHHDYLVLEVFGAEAATKT